MPKLLSVKNRLKPLPTGAIKTGLNPAAKFGIKVDVASISGLERGKPFPRVGAWLTSLQSSQKLLCSFFEVIHYLLQFFDGFSPQFALFSCPHAQRKGF
jgi:hypothetical protein